MKIRPTQIRDIAHLPDIEQSAGLRFRDAPGLEWLADGENRSLEFHCEMVATGACLVSVDEHDVPHAFLCAQPRGSTLHIWELAVTLALQGRGIGRALLMQSFEDARGRGIDAVTLTTFRDLPWNEVFYRRLGFRTLASEELDEALAEILRLEIANGLPAHRRCAMRFSLKLPLERPASRRTDA